MLFQARLTRYAHREGNRVTWGNLVGPYLGQSSTWTFVSESEAEEFKIYAGSEGAPALDTDTLWRKAFLFRLRNPMSNDTCSRCSGWMGIGYFGYLGHLELRICFICHEQLKQDPSSDTLWSLSDLTQQRNCLRHDLCALNRDCICYREGWTHQTLCCGDESRYGVCMRARGHQGDHMTCSGAEGYGHAIASWAWKAEEKESIA